MASPSNPLVNPSVNPVADPLQEALRQNQELHAELDRLRAASNQNSTQQLQEFVYAASHDLQEPLRAIMTNAQMLDRHLSNDPAAREYCAFVLDNAQRMKDLVQALLAYSRAGSAKRRSSISLNLPLQRTLLKLAPEIGAADAKITRGDLPRAVADEGEIALVFEHLIGNALIYRGGNARPEIVIEAEQGSDDTCCTISVADNGCGIDARFSDQVLLPFKRLHGKDVPGHGLGLAICDKIVRAHQGRLWVDTQASPGATIRFTLPV